MKIINSNQLVKMLLNINLSLYIQGKGLILISNTFRLLRLHCINMAQTSNPVLRVK